jgi:hypothetical protein
MSIPESKNLFHGSGSEETLNYFLARLKAGDLSPEEALAMLSAVHADLGKGSSADPSIYQSYSNAMESLHRTMPAAYDFVVSTWGSRKMPDSASGDDQTTVFDENPTCELISKDPAAKTESGLDEITASEEEPDDAEEPLEPGEVEEKEYNSSDEIEEGEEQPQEEETEEPSGEEMSEGDIQREEDEAEESPEPKEEGADEFQGETEVEESEEEENESSEEEPAISEDESESGEESSTEESAGESIADDGEADGETAETEWPEIEQPPPEEPLENFEEDESSMPPEE